MDWGIGSPVEPDLDLGVDLEMKKFARSPSYPDMDMEHQVPIGESPPP